MRLSSTLCVLALAPLLAACVGEVITTPISPADLVTTGKQLHGIVGYRAIQVIEVSTLTQFSADQKTFTTDCGRTPTQKIVSVPDQQHPLLLTYNHGILEGYTFGVTLNADGVITGVNSTSVPDQGKTLANFASAATDFAKLGTLNTHIDLPGLGNKPPCNSSPTFDKYLPVPAVSSS